MRAWVPCYSALRAILYRTRARKVTHSDVPAFPAWAVLRCSAVTVSRVLETRGSGLWRGKVSFLGGGKEVASDGLRSSRVSERQALYRRSRSVPVVNAAVCSATSMPSFEGPNSAAPVQPEHGSAGKAGTPSSAAA